MKIAGFFVGFLALMPALTAWGSSGGDPIHDEVPLPEAVQGLVGLEYMGLNDQQLARALHHVEGLAHVRGVTLLNCEVGNRALGALISLVRADRVDLRHLGLHACPLSSPELRQLFDALSENMNIHRVALMQGTVAEAGAIDHVVSFLSSAPAPHLGDLSMEDVRLAPGLLPGFQVVLMGNPHLSRLGLVGCGLPMESISTFKEDLRNALNGHYFHVHLTP